MASKIFVYKISPSSVKELYPELPDFDSITMKLPSGLYTTFRTYARRTKVIGLREHLDRLYLPAKVQGIRPAIPRESDFRKLLSDLLSRNGSQEARVRMILETSKKPGETYVLIQDLQPLPPEVYRDGVRVDLSTMSRETPTVKRTLFIRESSSERKRLGGDVFEILLAHNGRILEGMTSNFFYVREGVLHTAGRGVLAGVTRRTVTTLASQAGIPVRYKSLPLREIPRIEEACITSSSRGVVPVVQVADNRIGSGIVGKVTTQLMNLYERRIEELAESIL
ncbi:MAG TPA: aminotransferase class IV [Anaerolineales bacterium]|nr:aminotransferase class IV [Anaerolineales bacterium]